MMPHKPSYTPEPNKWASALYVALATAAIAFVAVLAAVYINNSYGWALFVALPSISGALVVLLHGMRGPTSFGAFCSTGLLSMLLLGAACLIFGVEGLVCMLMASPLWLAGMLIGIACAYPIHLAFWNNRGNRRGFDVLFALALLLAIPGSMGADSTATTQLPVIQVTTIIDIDASPEVVWPLAAACGQIDEQPSWLFRVGVAYPLATTLSGIGVGAQRTCLLSTGPMLETVTLWNPGKLLRFKADTVPDAMKEMSPLGDIHPPHLHGYFTVLQGQFQLVPIPGPNGTIRTRVIGTSWYQNRMAPQWYWQLWCDSIVHGVHQRVLQHIKDLAEKAS